MLNISKVISKLQIRT